MRFIGITGGVGAGKSAVLSVLEKMDRTIVLRADDLAKELTEPVGASGRLSPNSCYEALKEAFSEEGVFDAEGKIIASKMSERIFSDDEKRARANDIIHPAVKREILSRVDNARSSECIDFFFLEAALLLEEEYDAICDEIWYIYASEAARRERLAGSRGYSDAKISAIFEAQLSEEEFRRRCSRVIDNEGSPENTRAQIAEAIKEIRRKREGFVFG